MAGDLLAYAKRSQKLTSMFDMVFNSAGISLPGPMIRDKILVRYLLQKLHFHNDLLEVHPAITNRNSFAGKVTKWHAIDDMFNEQDDTIASSSKLSLRLEELLEVARRES